MQRPPNQTPDASRALTDAFNLMNEVFGKKPQQHDCAANQVRHSSRFVSTGLGEGYDEPVSQCRICGALS